MHLIIFFFSDIRSLAKNKSYVLSVVAFTCVTYCAGAMMWWGPNFAFAGTHSNIKGDDNRYLRENIFMQIHIHILYVNANFSLHLCICSP